MRFIRRTERRTNSNGRLARSEVDEANLKVGDDEGDFGFARAQKTAGVPLRSESKLIDVAFVVFRDAFDTL